MRRYTPGDEKHLARRRELYRLNKEKILEERKQRAKECALLGICIHCPEPAKPGVTRCERHWLDHKRRNTKRNRKLGHQPMNEAEDGYDPSRRDSGLASDWARIHARLWRQDSARRQYLDIAAKLEPW